ncbi:MAG: YqeG family HAD IIIA-type phosphatase [Thermotogae bacterium]|nr:MAG: YqeG family HAD IIIA-type phosphatase [Thermotogota bacterium]
MVELKARILNTLRLPLPKEQLRSVKELNTERLSRLGIDTILLDFDNTIVPWKRELLDDSMREVIYGWIKDGFKVAVVTNAGKKRMEKVDLKAGEPVPVFHSLFKPGVKRLRRVLQKIGSEPEKTAMVGDLFFTDIIAGNRLGLYTILVNPYLIGVTNYFHKLLAFLSKVLFYAFYYTVGWFFHIADLNTPNETFESVHQIDFDRLIQAGFDTFIFDYDNTLSWWRTPPSAEAVKLLESLVSKGATVIVASNGRKERLESFKKYFGDRIVVLGNARKPLKRRVERLLKRLGKNPHETVVIGDQLFTDIFMGSLLKAYTIKVEPIDRSHEFFVTRFLRSLEKTIELFQRGKPTVRGREDEKV